MCYVRDVGDAGEMQDGCREMQERCSRYVEDVGVVRELRDVGEVGDVGDIRDSGYLRDVGYMGYMGDVREY